jgi:hypothetical protein
MDAVILAGRVARQPERLGVRCDDQVTPATQTAEPLSVLTGNGRIFA